MSRRGNCWDNAPQESFFGHFKDEASIKACTNLEELRNEIKQYLIYYNF
jgi:putative transposase